MKKLILTVAVATMIAGVVFVACQKETTTTDKKEVIKQGVKQQKKPSQASLIMAALSTGFELEAGKRYSITYRTGVYYKKEIKILGGFLYYSIETGCHHSPDDVCDVIAVHEIGVSMSIFKYDDDGEINNLVPIMEQQENMYGGYIAMLKEGVVSDKNVLVFLTDISQMEDNTMYLGEVLHLREGFALQPELAYELGILPENQIIPAGEYRLYKYGDVRMWYIELDKIILE